MTAFIRASIIASAVGAWGTMAAAQEACVVCSGPQATYRCSIEKTVDKLSRYGAAGEKALQLVCARELARQGKHEKCAARRDAATSCEGDAREIPLASLIDAYTTPPPVAAPVVAAPAVTAEAPKAADAKQEPPRTMLELAERTGETSKQQLKKVGNAAERTWTCIASLFEKC
jgi:hypothetical protein